MSPKDAFPKMCRALAISLLILIACYKNQVSAQVFPVQKFTEEDGLSHSNVYRIFQDHRGFLWFGTEFGLSRYDGNAFTNYVSTSSVSLNTVTGIDEWEGNKIVLFTYRSGITLLDHDSLIHLYDCDKVRSVIHGIADGEKLWFINKEGGLYLYYNNTLSAVSLSYPSGHKVIFTTLHRSADNQVYFGTTDGLFIEKNGALKPFMADTVKGQVYALVSDQANNTWAGMSNKIIEIGKDHSLRSFSTGSISEISDLLADHNQLAWVAIPKKGLLMLKDGQFTNITKELKLQNILINALFQDHSGNIWIGTHGAGLFCVNTMDIVNYPARAGVINNYANSIASAGHQVIIGSIGTISLYNGKNIVPLKMRQLSPSGFVYFVALSGDTILAGTPSGIYYKDMAHENVTEFLDTHGALAYCRDATGKIWIGRFGDFGNLVNNRFVVATYPENNKRVNCICRYGPRGVLLGTDSGYIVYDGYRFRHYNAGHTTSTNHINAILQDHRQRTWIATDWGLFVLDGRTKTYYTSADGLCGNRCTALAEDEEGNIWIGTLTGLNKFDGAHFIPFDSRSGLSSNAVLSVCPDANNNLWVGTVNGVSLIMNKKTHAVVTPPPVYITRVKIKNKTCFFPSSITLGPSDKSLHIRYAGLEFPRADKIEYQYKIEPENEKWRQISGNELELSSFAPGQYLLLIRARHTGYSWNPQPARLRITVLAAWWQRPWVLIGFFSLVLFLAYRGLRFIIIRREKEKRQKILLQNKMIRLKQQALNAMINPHFVFNCLNSVQGYIYANEKDQARHFLVKFSRLIRMTLEHGQDAFISLSKEIERIELYLGLELLRFGTKFSFNISIAEAIDIKNTVIPNMLIQPYVENAIKHGIMPKKEGGHIMIAFHKLSPQVLSIIIEDNGVGISQKNNGKARLNGQHKSMGLQLNEERMRLLGQLHKKTFKTHISETRGSHGEVTGTRVELVIACEDVFETTEESLT